MKWIGWGWWDEWGDNALQIQDSKFEPWARYLSVTDAPQNIESLQVSRKETFCFFDTWRPEWGSNPRSPTFKQANLTTAPGPPPFVVPVTFEFNGNVFYSFYLPIGFHWVLIVYLVDDLFRWFETFGDIFLYIPTLLASYFYTWR